MGLLDENLEPKEWALSILRGLKGRSENRNTFDFIDLDKEEYLNAPEIHFPRLWDHFRDA